MTKREKVLLGVMGAAALFAAGMFALGGKTLPGPGSAQDKTVAAARTGAENQAKAVAGAAPGAFETQVAEMARQPWNAVAFYDKPLDMTGEMGRGAGPLPAYTGYVELGALRLAVIDGYEYREGDELETGGFQVEEIKPTQVTLRGIDTGKLLRVPYQDPSFFTQ